jgi:hypothetical protein
MVLAYKRRTREVAQVECLYILRGGICIPKSVFNRFDRQRTQSPARECAERSLADADDCNRSHNKLT